MPDWNIIQAVNDALRVEMRRDPRVVVLGEDVGKFGGVFRATAGLYEEFGPDRVIDTPLAEGGIHAGGLQVICPSNPVDAKGLLISAIRGEDPVLFLEPKRVYRAARGEVPEGEYTVPIGEARAVREGRGMTVLAWGAMLHEAQQACAQVAEQGLDPELIDLRTLWPLDVETVTRSVRKTGRCAIVQEAPRTGGFASEISALVQERCFTSLEAPILRITGWDTPFPYTLENEYLPLAPRIAKGLRELAAYLA
jgi:2-oxoisovalerate dehydrogenase E1 component beta subunit